MTGHVVWLNSDTNGRTCSCLDYVEDLGLPCRYVNTSRSPPNKLNLKIHRKLHDSTSKINDARSQCMLE